MLHITHSSVETGACLIASAKTVLCCHSTFFLALTSTSMDLHWLESHDGALRPLHPCTVTAACTKPVIMSPLSERNLVLLFCICFNCLKYVYSIASVSQSKNLQRRWRIIGINGWDSHHNRIRRRGIWKRYSIREIRNIVWRHDCMQAALSQRALFVGTSRHQTLEYFLSKPSPTRQILLPHLPLQSRLLLTS